MRKLFEIIVALFVISVLAFIFLKLAPGDPAENYLRASHMPITDRLLARTREELGLNSPLIFQYLSWLRRALTLNFGMSYLLKKSALQVTLSAFKNTMTIASLSFLILALTAIPLGIYSALNQNKISEKLIQLFSFFSVSVPIFWFGFLMILFFSVKLKWLPVSGKGSIRHYVLPVLSLALPFIGQYTAFIKKLCVEEMKKYYFENAVMRGLKLRYFVKNYIFKSIRIPLVSSLIMTYAGLLTGTILVENIYSWPGIGRLFINSIQASDIPVIQVCMLFFGVIFIIFNTVANGIAFYFDPKLSRKRR